jgi:mannose-6-phosphate isomerase-like protein (cupin superfamily)
MRYRHIFWTCLLSAVVPAISVTQEQPKGTADKLPILHSRAYHFEELKAQPGVGVKMTPVFDGITTRGERIELHLSELVPGAQANPVHAHHNEEIMVIREGNPAGDDQRRFYNYGAGIGGICAGGR